MNWLEKFWSKVRKTKRCWTWTACTRDGKHPYGMFGVGQGKVDRAHRVAWALTYGPIPDGMCVLHECDNPICVRPDHLFLGSRLDNAIDRDKKGRGSFGTRNGMATLTGSKIREIARLSASGISQSVIAKKFKIQQSTVSRIVTGKRWARARQK